jgi:hypothetical protein
MSAPCPDATALAALAEKYRTLAGLRAHRDGPAPTVDRATLRALADRHPGCLRELDTLGQAELERRALAADEAARGGAREPWMDWVWAYHRLMRAALATKRALGRDRPDPARARTLAEAAARIAGWPLDEGFVQTVAAPPQGRLSVTVLRLLAGLFAVPPAAIATALFPRRRPSPYTLEEQ